MHVTLGQEVTSFSDSLSWKLQHLRAHLIVIQSRLATAFALTTAAMTHWRVSSSWRTVCSSEKPSKIPYFPDIVSSWWTKPMSEAYTRIFYWVSWKSEYLSTTSSSCVLVGQCLTDWLWWSNHVKPNALIHTCLNTIIFIHRIMKKRPELKIILSSATMDAQLFADYFNRLRSEETETDECAILSVQGRQYPGTPSFLILHL